MTWLADRRALSIIGRNRRLVRAAGISSAVLVCHPDTWAEIRAIAGELKPPQAVAAGAVAKREDGLADVTLSGVQIVAVMHAMRVAAKAWKDGDIFLGRLFPPPRRATAKRAYLALARTAEQVSGPAGTVPPIVIDDRVPDARP